jgi:glycosyltransferase involved in cell wall biosynthesis
MRILMLTSSYPKYPGETTAPFIEEIASALALQGHVVHLVAPYHPDVQRDPIERGVALHFYRYAPHPALNVWGYAQSLVGDVDVKRQTLAAAPFALAGSMKGLLDVLGYTPIVTYHPQQRFDIVHAHWAIPNGPPAAFAAWWKNFPLVVSLHGSDVYLAEKHWAIRTTAALTLRAAAAVTACSSDLMQRGIRLGARAEHSMVIPYGINPDEFCPNPAAKYQVCAELGIDVASVTNGKVNIPMVLAMGRLVHKKGFGVLLEAWAHLLQAIPNARLVVVGYGDLRQELEQQVQRLGIGERVYFTGQLEREKAALYMAATDVFALPIVRDQGTDGLPNVLLEAMSAGCAVVASDVAGVPDVIEHEKHGLLVPERDPKALAEAISRLLYHPKLANQLGMAARQRIEANLTWDTTADQFEQVYAQVIERRTTKTH